MEYISPFSGWDKNHSSTGVFRHSNSIAATAAGEKAEKAFDFIRYYGEESSYKAPYNLFSEAALPQSGFAAKRLWKELIRMLCIVLSLSSYVTIMDMVIIWVLTLKLEDLYNHVIYQKLNNGVWCIIIMIFGILDIMRCYAGLYFLSKP